MKFQLNSTLIKPVLQYNFESWSMKISDETRLDYLERKVLQTICKGIQERGDTGRHYNFELYEV